MRRRKKTLRFSAPTLKSYCCRWTCRPEELRTELCRIAPDNRNEVPLHARPLRKEAPFPSLTSGKVPPQPDQRGQRNHQRVRQRCFHPSLSSKRTLMRGMTPWIVKLWALPWRSPNPEPGCSRPLGAGATEAACWWPSILAPRKERSSCLFRACASATSLRVQG